MAFTQADHHRRAGLDVGPIRERKRHQDDVKASQHQPAAPLPVMSLLEQDMLASDIGQTSNSHAGQRYLKVVFALPEDEAGRQRLLQAFRLQASFFGATVQACSLHDHHPL